MNTDGELNPISKEEIYNNEKQDKDLSNITLHNINEKCTEWLANSFFSNDNFSICSDCSDTSGSSVYTENTDTSEEESFVPKNNETSVHYKTNDANVSINVHNNRTFLISREFSSSFCGFFGKL